MKPNSPKPDLTVADAAVDLINSGGDVVSMTLLLDNGRLQCEVELTLLSLEECSTGKMKFFNPILRHCNNTIPQKFVH